MRRSALISFIVLTACMLPPRHARAAADALSLAGYRTQLFNLLMNRRSPVDGKNYYDKKFDLAFDAMLAQSSMPKASAVPLKCRLLSGPQPDPVRVRDKDSGRQYIYYEACQAHACDDDIDTAIGNPVLHLSRNTSGNKTSFNLAIEQGP